MDFRQWNAQGLIPGPQETEEEFLKRAQFCLQLKGQEEMALPFEASNQASQEILEEAFPKTKPLYGITPHWVPVFLTNHQLAPWHGGCAWIFQLNEKTPTSAFLQLRSHFRHRPTYLGLYQRKELIAHELAHVGRMMYEEPQFEEVLAYRSSASAWRRWLGPIVQSARESLLFILILGGVVMAHFALIAIDHPQANQMASVLALLFMGFIGLALARLGWRQWQLKRALRRLSRIYQSEERAAHVLYRLTDQEIRLFASSSLEKVKQYITNQSSFRWQFILENYPISYN